MSLLHNYDIATTHREVCIAVLDAFLPHGSMNAFAESIGVTPVWFSNFRKADSFSLPSFELGQRIAAQLPAPEYYRHAFIEHLVAARQAHERAQQGINQPEQLHVPNHPAEVELARAFGDAIFSTDFQTTQQRYLRMKALAMLVVNSSVLSTHPLLYLNACGWLLNVNSILDTVADGLYWAKLGLHISQLLTKYDFATESERLRFEKVRHFLARDVALGYHNLGLEKQALQMYEMDEAILKDHVNNRESMADMARNKLSTLALLPRPVLAEAEVLTRQAFADFEPRNDNLNILLTQERMARVHIAIGNRLNMRRARNLLENLTDEVNQSPQAGAIHRATVMKTVAKYHWVQGDRTTWKQLMTDLLKLIRQTGLLHQYRLLQREYGSELYQEELRQYRPDI